MLLTLMIIGAAATWRLTYMFQEESGPWAIFEKLRAKIWPLEETSGSFREGFFCFMCMSVWIGIVLALLLWLLPVAFYVIAVPATLSTGAIFINDAFNKDK